MVVSGSPWQIKQIKTDKTDKTDKADKADKADKTDKADKNRQKQIIVIIGETLVTLWKEKTI